MEQLIPVLTGEQIEEKVALLGKKISADFSGTEPVIVGVLNGAFVFMADLVRQLTLECFIDFIGVASYGQGTETSGDLSLTKDLEMDIAHKSVLIVEDIVDTGLTTAFVRDHIRKKGAQSVRLCAMIDKTGRRRTRVDVDYAGHRVSEGFLVGYGLDHAGKYRGRAGIYVLKS